MSCVNLISLTNVVIMERVSLVGALLLLLECLFPVFKVYDNSLFIYGVFLKIFLGELALRSSLSFAFAFDDAIPYP